MEQCETEGCSGVVFKQHLCLVCANKLFDTATSSERVSISREDAKDAEVLFRASAVMAANYDNMATSTDFERSADRIKTALEAANE